MSCHSPIGLAPVLSWLVPSRGIGNPGSGTPTHFATATSPLHHSHDTHAGHRVPYQTLCYLSRLSFGTISERNGGLRICLDSSDFCPSNVSLISRIVNSANVPDYSCSGMAQLALASRVLSPIRQIWLPPHPSKTRRYPGLHFRVERAGMDSRCWWTTWNVMSGLVLTFLWRHCRTDYRTFSG